MSSKILKNAFNNWIIDYSRLVIVGVGNPLRTDDGVGIEIVSRLNGHMPKNVLLLDCGTVPESYVRPIRKFSPSHILIIDAANMNSEPGCAMLVLPEQVVGFNLSTHNLPMSIFSNYLASQTNAKIAFLVIQPLSNDFGEGLSPIMEKTVQWIIDIIKELITKGHNVE